MTKIDVYFAVGGIYYADKINFMRVDIWTVVKTHSELFKA